MAEPGAASVTSCGRRIGGYGRYCLSGGSSRCRSHGLGRWNLGDRLRCPGCLWILDSDSRRGAGSLRSYCSLVWRITLRAFGCCYQRRHCAVGSRRLIHRRAPLRPPRDRHPPQPATAANRTATVRESAWACGSPKVMTPCGKICWQAEAPAPRWSQWGRRFRLPTGYHNSVTKNFRF